MNATLRINRRGRPVALAIGCSLGLACIFVALVFVVPARADVGVKPVLPGGSNLQPEGETPIQMAAEKVVMTVRSATAADNAAIMLNPEAYGYQFQPVWFPAVAEVEADFTMRNPTGDPVSMTVWFPLASALENVAWDELNPEEIVPRLADFQVAVDGSPVETTVGELPNPQGADRPPLPWASFPVTFPAGADTNIHVSYLLPLHQSIKGSELALYYIFQTGAGWAGPIGQAELIVNLPYPASVATMAGIQAGSFGLPYNIATEPADLPAGAVLDGNQARWTWQDFEPGPKDDFSIWIMDPGEWQELDTARAAAQADPGNGQAWLDLASVYRSLATAGYNSPSIFSSSYLQSGIEAFHKAAGLLPEHPAPHAGMALLTLASYMRGKDAPPEVIQTVQDEMEIARNLEAQNPSLAEEAGITSSMVEEILEIYVYNDATATADWIALSTEWAKETAEVTLPPEPTLTPSPAHISTSAPSATPQPLPTILPTPLPTSAEAVTGGGQSMIFGVTVVVILLVVVGYLALRKMKAK